jgi:hypothetical protein
MADEKFWVTSESRDRVYIKKEGGLVYPDPMTDRQGRPLGRVDLSTGEVFEFWQKGSYEYGKREERLVARVDENGDVHGCCSLPGYEEGLVGRVEANGDIYRFSRSSSEPCAHVKPPNVQAGAAGLIWT